MCFFADLYRKIRLQKSRKIFVNIDTEPHFTYIFYWHASTVYYKCKVLSIELYDL